jgi:hypothetical protein
MKNLRNLRTGIICLSFLALALTSCIKDTEVALQGVADVIIQDMKTDQGVKYAIVVYAGANHDIQSAKVTGPTTAGSKVYQLTATSSKQQYVYAPQAGDYTSELPAKGNYTIEIITTDGETLTGTDAVGDEKLSPIVIKTATMGSHSLKITWDKVTDASAYAVRIYSADKSEVLYSSSYLTTSVVEHELSASTVGWFTGKSPVINTNYVVELIAVRVETSVTVDTANNLQFITVDSKTIKWE